MEIGAGEPDRALGRDQLKGEPGSRAAVIGAAQQGEQPWSRVRYLLPLQRSRILGPALAQEIRAPSRIAMPATGAYPVRQDMSQLLGSNLIGAKVVSTPTRRSAGSPTGGERERRGGSRGDLDRRAVRRRRTRTSPSHYKSLNIVRNKAGDAHRPRHLAATRDDLRQAAEFKTAVAAEGEKDRAAR